MSGRTFVDTNIIVCAHDLDAGSKHDVVEDLNVGQQVEGMTIVNPFIE